MATVFLALFDPEEFEAIKSVLGPDMTDTYQGWTDLTLDRFHQISVNGDVAVADQNTP